MNKVRTSQRKQALPEMLQPLSVKLPTKLFLLLVPAGPRSRVELQELGDDIANRFDARWENALDYVNKWTDRNLNRARGLLTFDGLVLTALGAVYRESHRIPAKLVLAGSVCAVIAAGMLLLTLFAVNLGGFSKYGDAKAEFPPSVAQTIVNGKSVVAAGLLSLLALLCLLISFGIVLLSNDLG